ncbi:hypothetical protein QQX09_11220 [Demequina sp. SYSU T00192]|uniref:PH domain-containing protein n=1 Tax=Demequina litoralis TaxID=3051660 RepID=A0ABT8GBA2_9MICO|nr:hypothetical protein [Demequina sp. SYSU T00192]MDN4476426.1 hypothetical protein [Demequina sp. SYSU T00192]
MRFSYALGLPRQLVLSVTAVSAVEIPVAHLLLARWNGTVALAITALSIAFIAWVLVDWAAAVRRPVTLDATTLTLRRGLRAPVDVPVDRIVSVRSVASNDGLPKAALHTVYAGEAALVVELDDGTAHAVAVDDPSSLLRALEAVIGPARAGLESQA